MKKRMSLFLAFVILISSLLGCFGACFAAEEDESSAVIEPASIEPASFEVVSAEEAPDASLSEEESGESPEEDNAPIESVNRAAGEDGAGGTYDYGKSAVSGCVTLLVEYDEPLAGQPTTFHVSASGGSGAYKFRMDVPVYYNPDRTGYQTVGDPTRGDWAAYTSECESVDYIFAMTASGIYSFSFYAMDTTSQVYWLKVGFTITISDANYPSVASIVSSAVAQCREATDGSDYAKALWLHDWMIERVSFDNTLVWCSAESVLTRGLGICEGYKDAYALLLTAAGIENKEIRDIADGHTWNAVKLDGEWYQIDATWNDSAYDGYDFDATHLYFGLTDELMAVAHEGHTAIYSAEGYETRSTSLENNYFVRSEVAYQWVTAYYERIMTHLDAGETEFSIAADNTTLPASISGIQNGIIAWVFNQLEWDGVLLQATASGTEFSFVADYCDINGDKKLDVNDLILLVKHLLGQAEAEKIVHGPDLNRDDAFNLADVVYLLRRLVLLSAA